MMILARWIKHPLDVAVQCSHDAGSIVGPTDVATRFRASIAAVRAE
jgi:hypothetical protein